MSKSEKYVLVKGKHGGLRAVLPLTRNKQVIYQRTFNCLYLFVKELSMRAMETSF